MLHYAMKDMEAAVEDFDALAEKYPRQQEAPRGAVLQIQEPAGARPRRRRARRVPGSAEALRHERFCETVRRGAAVGPPPVYSIVHARLYWRDRPRHHQHALHRLRSRRPHRRHRPERARADLPAARLGGARPERDLAPHPGGDRRGHGDARPAPAGPRRHRHHQPARDHRRVEPAYRHARDERARVAGHARWRRGRGDVAQRRPRPFPRADRAPALDLLQQPENRAGSSTTSPARANRPKRAISSSATSTPSWSGISPASTSPTAPTPAARS